MKASLLLAFVPLVAATNDRVLPPCTEPYTPFASKGCYEDANSQTLTYRSLSDQNQMTIEKCTAECKSE